MSEPTPAVAAAGNAELTKEELIAKLNHLSETQNQLINVLNGLQRKAEDPFLQLKHRTQLKICHVSVAIKKKLMHGWKTQRTR